MIGPDLPWAAWGLEALIGSALLMAVVLLVRRPVRRAFGPDIAYALWALPLLRLVLPPLPASWAQTAASPVARAREQVIVLLDMPVAPAPAAARVAAPLFDPAWLAPTLLLLWAAGAVAFLVWHALAHRRFCRTLVAAMTAEAHVDGIRVIETAAASGPLAFGVWRRTIALPSDLAERFDAEERDLALAHEMGHHARGDLLANWVALLVLALHWFSPLAWHAFRAFRIDQEMANDARVLAGLSPMRRHAYGCALVKAASPVRLGWAASTACHLHTIDDLKGRLKMLTTKRVSRTRLTAGAGALSLLIVGGLGVTASGSAAARMRTSVETATGVDLGSAEQAVSAPLPPPPPPPGDASPVVPPVPPVSAIDPAHRKIVKPIRAPATPAEAAAFKNGTSITKHRMIITMPGDPARRIEFQDVPAVSESKCGISSDKPSVMLIDGKDGEKRKMVICIDRIEQVAAEGATIAANSKDIERNAYVHALAGLRGTRAWMTVSTDMTGDQRKAALDGIDTAIRELEGDLAKAQ